MSSTSKLLTKLDQAQLEILSEFKLDLKAILISAQCGLTCEEISRDYQTINFEKLPFEDLGLSSIDELLKCCKDTVKKVSGEHNKYFAVASKKSTHISKFVQDQRKMERAGCMKDGGRGEGRARDCVQKLETEESGEKGRNVQCVQVKINIPFDKKKSVHSVLFKNH